MAVTRIHRRNSPRGRLSMDLKTATFACLVIGASLLAGIALVGGGLFSGHSQTSALTTVPTRMNFQGRLTDSTGAIKANGSYNMQLRLYTAASGGTAVWTENRLVSATQGITLTNGLFAIQLGEITSLPANLFASGPLYLEIQLPTPTSATTASPVWTEPAMSPRNQLATSAYAYNAETLDGLDSDYFRDASNLNAGTIASARVAGSYTGITGTGALAAGSIATGFGTILTNNTISGTQLNSTVATGTAPLTVASTTLVTNLNADLLDGQSGGYYQDATNLNAGTIASARVAGSYTGITGTGALAAGSIASGFGTILTNNTISGTQLNSTVATGTAPLTVASTTKVTNLNVDLLDGLDSIDIVQRIKTADNITTRLDSGFYESSTATIAEGYPQDSNSWYHLLSNTHSNGANYYAMQFAGSFFNSNAIYYRATNGSGTTGWNQMWHQGNDGDGSGLDADTVGGILAVDSGSNVVSIGTPDATGTVLVLDTKNTAGDPTGVDGAMYYNSSAGKFRCYEAAVWKDCIGNATANLNPVWPDGAAGTPVNISIASNSSYTVPVGKTLYLSHVYNSGATAQSLRFNGQNVHNVATSDLGYTFPLPLPVESGGVVNTSSSNTLRIIGYLY